LILKEIFVYFVVLVFNVYICMFDILVIDCMTWVKQVVSV